MPSIAKGIFFFLLCSFPYFSNAQLKVEITGITQVKGKMFMAIYDSEAGFLDVEKAVQKTMVAIEGKEFSHLFTGLPTGTYALAIFQDENGNNEMDTNWIGMPKEGFGFSNDAPVRMGPPSFADASIALVENEEKVIQIKLR